MLGIDILQSAAGDAKNMCVGAAVAVEARFLPGKRQLDRPSLADEELQIPVDRAQAEVRQMPLHHGMDLPGGGVPGLAAQSLQNRLALPGPPLRSFHRFSNQQ
ncbi:MAG: hypothetical protein V1774_09570 [Candidatus Eisenbacteria bacterium]